MGQVRRCQDSPAATMRSKFALKKDYLLAAGSYRFFAFHLTNLAQGALLIPVLQGYKSVLIIYYLFQLDIIIVCFN